MEIKRCFPKRAWKSKDVCLIKKTCDRIETKGFRNSVLAVITIKNNDCPCPINNKYKCNEFCTKDRFTCYEIQKLSQSSKKRMISKNCAVNMKQYFRTI